MGFNERFTKRLHFDSLETKGIYTLLAQIDAIKGQWSYSNTLSPQMVEKLQRTAIITSAAASNRIEDIVLSEDEVKDLFSKLKIQKFSKRNEPEVAGYLDLLQNILNSYETISFSQNTVLFLHAQLLRFSEKDERHRGKYKFGSNQVVAKDPDGKVVGVIFDPTPPHWVMKEMEELIEWTNKNLEKEEFHPLLIISNFVIEFLAIHPFQDGNGRLSRLLTILLLLKNGYAFVPFVSHEKIIEEKKTEYYLALREGQKNRKTDLEEIHVWVLFFLNIINEQAQQALKLLTEDNIEIYLSEKQEIIWNFALKQEIFNRKDVIEATGLKPRTVEASISKLVSMNKLEKIGEGRASRYIVKK